MAEQTKLSIGRQLRQLRGEQSQEIFAKKLGMQRSQLSRLENGDKSGPTLRTLTQVADRLGMRLIIHFASCDDRKRGS